MFIHIYVHVYTYIYGMYTCEVCSHDCHFSNQLLVYNVLCVCIILCVQYVTILPSHHLGSKCSKYNPSESTKLYDKATNRKVGVLFNPSTVVEHLRRKLRDPTVLSPQEDCLLVYIQVS